VQRLRRAWQFLGRADRAIRHLPTADGAPLDLTNRASQKQFQFARPSLVGRAQDRGGHGIGVGHSSMVKLGQSTNERFSPVLNHERQTLDCAAGVQEQTDPIPGAMLVRRRVVSGCNQAAESTLDLSKRHIRPPGTIAGAIPARADDHRHCYRNRYSR
jgi:hypothetical protein